jgi:trans-aconitate methyltransferase
MTNAESLVAAEFDKYAGDYDRMLAEGLVATGEARPYFERRRLEWVKARLDERSAVPRRLMDYGCGAGTAVPTMLELFGADSIVGVDPSSRLIQRARSEHGSHRATFKEVHEYQPAEEIDLAYCNGVFHHIPVTGRKVAAQYLWRSLRPNGYLAFWENNPWNPGTRYVMSRIPFDRDAVTLTWREATELLKSAGFHIVGTHHLFIFPRCLSVFRWMEPHLSAYPFGAQYLVLARKSGGRSKPA